jgi:hypothetical protein
MAVNIFDIPQPLGFSPRFSHPFEYEEKICMVLQAEYTCPLSGLQGTWPDVPAKLISGPIKLGFCVQLRR